MRRFIPLFLLFMGLFVCLALAGAFSEQAYALPEYSAQVGEPCLSCHISPSGGGPRGPRGQAWVGSDKPGNVPSLLESLEILGVHLEADPEHFLAPEQAIPPVNALVVETQSAHDLFHWLYVFDGN